MFLSLMSWVSRSQAQVLVSADPEDDLDLEQVLRMLDQHGDGDMSMPGKGKKSHKRRVNAPHKR